MNRAWMKCVACASVSQYVAMDCGDVKGMGGNLGWLE